MMMRRDLGCLVFIVTSGYCLHILTRRIKPFVVHVFNVGIFSPRETLFLKSEASLFIEKLRVSLGQMNFVGNRL